MVLSSVIIFETSLNLWSWHFIFVRTRYKTNINGSLQSLPYSKISSSGSQLYLVWSFFYVFPFLGFKYTLYKAISRNDQSVYLRWFSFYLFKLNVMIYVLCFCLGWSFLSLVSFGKDVFLFTETLILPPVASNSSLFRWFSLSIHGMLSARFRSFSIAHWWYRDGEHDQVSFRFSSVMISL